MKKIFIGIDFAKENFDAAIIEVCGLEELGDRQFETFPNDKKGCRQFMKWGKNNSGKSLEDEMLFCGEDTAHAAQFSANGFTERGSSLDRDPS